MMSNTIASQTAASLAQVERSTNEPGTGRRDPEILAELFAPEIVLPDQILAGERKDSVISGEKSLMLAVLEDGIRCFQGHLTNERSNPALLSAQSEEWIRAVDYDWPFSFNNVCETLNIDPDALRSSLLQWKEQQRATAADSEPTPTERKVYRLHLRTKRQSGVR
jgi:hypothetical protein